MFQRVVHGRDRMPEPHEDLGIPRPQREQFRIQIEGGVWMVADHGRVIALAQAAQNQTAPIGSMTSACPQRGRSEEHTSELQSHSDLVCRLLLEKKKNQDPPRYYLE